MLEGIVVVLVVVNLGALLMFKGANAGRSPEDRATEDLEQQAYLAEWALKNKPTPQVRRVAKPT